MKAQHTENSLFINDRKEKETSREREKRNQIKYLVRSITCVCVGSTPGCDNGSDSTARSQTGQNNTHTHAKWKRRRKKRHTQRILAAYLIFFLKKQTRSSIFWGASIIVNDDDDDAILPSHYRVSSVYRLNSHLDSNNPRGAVYRGTAESRSK